MILYASTHAPREGSDGAHSGCRHYQGISTRAPREGSDFVGHLVFVGVDISTHAPREGSDPALRYPQRPLSDFNPRSPRGERPRQTTSSGEHLAFQPTLPARGATPLPALAACAVSISTHAPREGSDLFRHRRSGHCRNFNPRSPRGERQHPHTLGRDPQEISTHAPREGSDGHRARAPRPTADFNPRSPRGERRARRSPRPRPMAISTHAPREGSDGRSPGARNSTHSFQPTLPARGATEHRDQRAEDEP